MIEVSGLTKNYGERVAVADLTFSVKPGVVTGFLGPNGSGKSTTMRLILGLDAPTSGTALVGGRRYHDIPDPMREIGAMLEARAIHSGRSARDHLRALAATHDIPDARVGEVLDLVGLTSVARKRAGTFSLGMGQRLGIASSLLGDPTPSSSTSRSTDWIPRASGGCVSCSPHSRARARRCSCRRT